MKRWIALAAAAAVSLVVLYGVLTHEEPTFEGRPSLPLLVEVDPGILRDYGPYVRAAARTWSDAAGCETVRIVSSGGTVHLGWDGDPVCDGGRDVPQSAAGVTTYCRDGRVQIRMRDLSERIAEKLTHELGHALTHEGHDRGDSVMARGAPSLYVTDEDRAALRRLCP